MMCLTKLEFKYVKPNKQRKGSNAKTTNLFKHPPAPISETQFINPVLQSDPIFHNCLFC